MLEKINSPLDLRKLSINDLKVIATEIRDLIIKTTSQTGGHVAPNLGVVELTLVLHYIFNTPVDRIIWDVGHQCYAHKIITGRRDKFNTLRQYRGIAGFPKRAESEYDVFDTGHSGNSISAALGMAVGDRLLKTKKRTIAVIGDGSIVTGMALEAMNHAGALQQDMIVVLNDNEMSIARSTGAIASYLNRVITGRMYNRFKDDTWALLGYLPGDLSEKARKAARKLEEGLKNLVVPSILFEELGFRYIGPVNGHDFNELIETFHRVIQLSGPILVHVVTQKGFGFAPAREHPEKFHGIGPFDIKTGESLSKSSKTFTEHFGNKIVELAEKDSRIVTITAGMCLGTGLTKFRERFPERFFDVGIAEQHAVTFAAGLAQSGLKPILAIYSTFLLRALDQILQDVCLQKLPVIFAVDRAGLVGEDGPTHHGVYDLSYLTMLPGMNVLAPRDEIDLVRMLDFAVNYDQGPVAIRYPRGGTSLDLPIKGRMPISLGRGEILRTGRDGAVLSVGSTVIFSLQAAEILAKEGINVTVADARSVKPVDVELIQYLAEVRHRLITVEENTLYGGFGNTVSLIIQQHKIKNCELYRIGIEDRFIEHGPREQLLRDCGLTPDRLAITLKEFLK
uniref:1-deoxy-D-xylulose-5-phosphate synthase n=1 Tax=candidate division WOR-3 bacterium TaxID=2052148 RepID=A0A7V3UZK0_UNCW3